VNEASVALHPLFRARRRAGLTQAKAAVRLGVSQGYVSLLENGRRNPSGKLKRSLERAYRLHRGAVDRELPKASQDDLARDLAALGYAPFAYLRSRAKPSPERVLLAALSQDDLDARLTEALPWVALTYPDLNWLWLSDHARCRNLQNRLGYVVTLAREVLERGGRVDAAAKLGAQESALGRSLLAREDTLGHESMSRVEREWLRENRPEQARRWNLLSDLRADQLPYAA